MSLRIKSLAVCLGLLGALAATAVPAQDVCDGVSPSDNASLQLVPVATGLTGRPLLVTAPPGDTERIFIVEQDGLIWLKKRGEQTADKTLFLDISGIVDIAGNEQGLLGVAFDPDHDTNGFFYVNYIRPGGIDQTIVARYKVDLANPDVIDGAFTPQTILLFAQPESNHNGGHLEFGPDGFLYISSGDGGGANDGHGSCGNGQNTGNLLGKLLRIDPSGGAALSSDCGPPNYAIPADNPLADGSGGACDEIWAYGLRNPWRFSFDRANGDLYIGDVGQNCWEEIDYAPASSSGGENYGWRQMEGTHCFNPLNAFNCNPAGVLCSGSPNCNDPSLVLPVEELDHGGPTCSITGGFVYRGCRMPNFDGAYFYGDYCDGSVLSFEVQGGVAVNHADWTATVDPGGSLAFGLTSFGQDGQGEIYVVDRSGVVSKLMPPFPDLEVSGAGVSDTDQFLLQRDGNWSWEDLHFNSMHPVEYYQVYRGVPNGTFECIHSTVDTSWIDGDAVDPGPGELAAYLVTGVNAGEESSSGNPPRTLINPCAAP